MAFAAILQHEGQVCTDHFGLGTLESTPEFTAGVRALGAGDLQVSVRPRPSGPDAAWPRPVARVCAAPRHLALGLGIRLEAWQGHLSLVSLLFRKIRV